MNTAIISFNDARERRSGTGSQAGGRDAFEPDEAGGRPRGSALSRREQDCLALVADGKSDRQIASLLDIALPTVAFHIKNARLKLNARTRAQAVARYLLATLRE